MKYTIYKSQAGFIISLLSEVDIEHHQKLQAIAKGKSVLSTKEDSTLFSYEVCTLSALSQARYVLQEAGFAQVWTWPTRVQSGGGEPRLYPVDEPHPWDSEQGPPRRESTIHQEGGLVMEAKAVQIDVKVGCTFTQEELNLLIQMAVRIPWGQLRFRGRNLEEGQGLLSELGFHLLYGDGEPYFATSEALVALGRLCTEAGTLSDEESVVASSILNLIRTMEDAKGSLGLR